MDRSHHPGADRAPPFVAGVLPGHQGHKTQKGIKPMSRGLWFVINARTRRSLTLLWTALFLCSLVLQSVQLAAPVAALASPTDGVFQLEGDATDGGAGDDWSNISAGPNGAQATTGILSDSAGRRFTGGSKDTLDMDDNSWDSASVPDKDDILHAYAALYDVGGNDTVVFGLDRYANNGTAHAGFWFFQDQIGVNANGSFSGQRTVGDVFIVSDFTSGGGLSTIKFYTWTASGLSSPSTGVACAPGSQNLCAISNAGDVSAPWAYTPKQGSAGTFPVASFFEGGINLDALFQNGAPCFSTFMAETRSSTSETAELKNFLLGGFETCAAPVIETQVKQDGQSVSKINKGESVVDVATFSGSDGPVTGSVDFFVCGPVANAKPDCANGGDQVGSAVTIANGSATSASFTPAALGWYCFRAEYTPNAGAHYLAGEHTNATTECFRVIPADVQIVKTPNDGSVSAGTPISFTLSWTNEGEGAAKGVVVTDSLPGAPGLDWGINTSTGSGSTCAITGNVGTETLTCTIGTIAGNPNFPNAAPVNGSVTVMSATFASSCGVIDNTGQITSTNDGTDTDPGKITVLCPDVNVVKTPNDGQLNASDAASFSIVVSNAGPGTATGVSLSDPLPAGLTWALGTITGATAADTEGVSCSVTGPVGTQVLSCSDASMASGRSFTVTVTTTTSSSQCATYPNVATVDATNESNDPSVTDDNTDPGSITVNCPDVQAIKTADASPVNAGDQIGFTVTIKNNGLGTAYGATGSDTLPAGIAWSIDGPANGWSISDGVLSFGPADMAAGASFAVHIVGTTDAADCGLVPNTVTVDATNESNDPSLTDDNSATASVTVNCPNLVVVKDALDSTISAGEVAAFSIVITNIGAGTAYDVSLTDTLPAGVTWNLDAVAFDGLEVADPAALCSITGTTLSCSDLGDLAPGDEISISISGDTDLDDCGTLLNTVTVDASNESNAAAITANNTDTASVLVDCPLLAIDKDADHVGPVVIGSQIGFTVTIKNNGAGTAFGVTVADTLDSDFAWSIATPSAGWTLVGNVLSFSGNLASGATSAVHVTAPTTIGDANDCGLVPNTAVLDHSSIDPTPASASESVRCPDTDITKTANDDFVEPNQIVTYTIHVKVVQGPVTNAVVTDTLPVGQTYVAGSAFPAPLSVSANGRTIVWQYTSLATGDPSTTITYQVKIDAGASAAPQQNRVELCVAEAAVDCVSAVELVTPQFPTILLIKTAGTAADGAVFATEAGPVTYTYRVTNTGPLTLLNVTVTDDAGTPGVAGDDFLATCPQTTLAPSASMTCTRTINVAVDTTNVAVARGVTVGGNPVQDDDPAVVQILEYGLLIDKTNNAPIEELELPDGSTAALPTAREGETVTYTLAYTFSGDPVTGAVIRDVLPLGVTYVFGSATNDPQFTFSGYTAATRTLTWTAPNVDESGSLSYRAKVDLGAAELIQPLVNVAVIDSDQTAPDDDDSEVFVPAPVAGATATPRITLPPTDVLNTVPQAPTNPGFALMIALLAIAAVVLTVGFVTPVPASVRERTRR